MRAALLAGALAALLHGAAARAAETQVPAGEPQPPPSTPERSLDTSGGAATDQTPDGAADPAKVPVNEGLPPTDSDTASLPAADTQSGVGGSGDVGVQAQPCPAPTPGSSASTQAQGTTAASDAAVGGSGPATDRPVTPPPPPPPVAPPGEAFTTTETDKQAYEPKAQPDMRGLTVTLGGGVEGYTQALAPELSVGPAVAVNATFRPTRIVGLELGYSGATNEIKHEDNVNGADIVRNGGQAAITLGLTATAVQPYVLGGIGVSDYNVRDSRSARFRDDTVGHVPLGAGLRTHFGDFTADARLGYSFLFDQEFARNVEPVDVDTGDVEFSNTGRYNATLNFGVTF